MISMLYSQEKCLFSSRLLLNQDQIKLERMTEPTGKEGRKARRPGENYLAHNKALSYGACQ